jgi:uncharacterized membrane protein ArfC
MSQPNWVLFAVTFALGLVLTFVLTVRTVKRHAPVGASAEESEPETTQISSDVETEPATTMIPVETESPTIMIPVETASPTTKIPIETEPPTTMIPVETASPTMKIPIANDAHTTKIPAANRPPRKRPPGAKGTRKIAVPYAPFGPGSARADGRGNGPSGWMVKGRSDTRLYYTPDDATYDGTVAQVWFRDEESAIRAHFTPWRKSSRK